MGTMASLDDDFETADKYFADSLLIGKETEEPFRIGKAYLSIARSLVRRGERDNAVDNYANAFKVFENAQMETLAQRTRKEMQEIVEEK